MDQQRSSNENQKKKLTIMKIEQQYLWDTTKIVLREIDNLKVYIKKEERLSLLSISSIQKKKKLNMKRKEKKYKDYRMERKEIYNREEKQEFIL